MSSRPLVKAIFAASCFWVYASSLSLHAESATGGYKDATIPESLKGPYISDPAVINLLDCPTAACNGPLSFSRLIRAKQNSVDYSAQVGNPFNLPVVKNHIVSIIKTDLSSVRSVGMVEGQQLSPRFLTDDGSRVELVGVVNRMDRQFIKDSFERKTPEQRHCGEISLIYRFGYSLAAGNRKSRLPVTLNLVFPALPSPGEGRPVVSCREVASRWLTEVRNAKSRTPSEVVEDLLSSQGALASIYGADIERLELNMQAYRKPASEAQDFGTEASYLMRVFKWDENRDAFIPAHLTNQIDRSKLLCSSLPDPQCGPKQALRQKLVKYLQQPAVVSAIDKGELDVLLSLGVLSDRATSISPGGAVRSANQPYWKAQDAQEEVISDSEIKKAFSNAKAAGVQLSFMKSVDDFRTRLNESTCTACHQTRAIAGFHFPGADRDGTVSVNSVFLAGSPQFYGDQPRRMKILEQIAKRSDRRLNEYELAAGYAARPLNSFKTILQNTQLIGGWGGACLIDQSRQSQREWNCNDGLECRRLFESANDMNVGTCIPKNGAFSDPANGKPAPEIGDALQIGTVTTKRFGRDEYVRRFELNDAASDKRISEKWLDTFSKRAGNSYYGAHQEYHEGKPDSPNLSKVDRRDRLTGGFPAGMLRFSECVNLPPEATCGLIASSGFNTCVERIQNGTATLDQCFSIFTSYAGVRACSASNPCRDDYICTKPLGYTEATLSREFDIRHRRLDSSPLFRSINNRQYDDTDFGQRRPDGSWMKNSAMGLCIPPYFVFQFRSDGHQAPP